MANLSTLKETGVNPGSFSEFTRERGIDPGTSEALAEHSKALTAWRLSLAAQLGVAVEDLHAGVAAVAKADHKED